MIIWLASYPRSSNTFFFLLLRRLYGLPAYSVYFRSPAAAEGHTVQDLDPAGLFACDTLDDLEHAPGHHFVKPHEPPMEEYPGDLSGE
jgi:hypothetical protein